MDGMSDSNLLENKKKAVQLMLSHITECGGESGSYDGTRMWRMARQSQLGIVKLSFTLITPGFVSNKISMSGGFRERLGNKCVCVWTGAFGLLWGGLHLSGRPKTDPLQAEGPPLSKPPAAPPGGLPGVSALDGEALHSLSLPILCPEAKICRVRRIQKASSSYYSKYRAFVGAS